MTFIRYPVPISPVVVVAIVAVDQSINGPVPGRLFKIHKQEAPSHDGNSCLRNHELEAHATLRQLLQLFGVLLDPGNGIGDVIHAGPLCQQGGLSPPEAVST